MLNRDRYLIVPTGNIAGIDETNTKTLETQNIIHRTVPHEYSLFNIKIQAHSFFIICIINVFINIIMFLLLG